RIDGRPAGRRLRARRRLGADRRRPRRLDDDVARRAGPAALGRARRAPRAAAHHRPAAPAVRRPGRPPGRASRHGRARGPQADRVGGADRGLSRLRAPARAGAVAGARGPATPAPGVRGGRAPHGAWAVVALGMVLAAVVRAAGLAYWLTRRVRALVHQTDALIRGDYAARLAPRGHDELARLAHDFNTLAETLAAAQRARQ